MSMPDEEGTNTAHLDLMCSGEMRARIAAFDWSQTPLGPVPQWPQNLKSAVEIMLTSRYPMLVWWGPGLIQFYNDAYVPVLGQRHPWGLGQPAAVCWEEAWPFVGALADAVIGQGVSTWSEELEMVMTRNGFPEEVYMTFSYSPIAGPNGQVDGLFCTCTEETQRVLGSRRLAALGAVSERTVEAATIDDACAAIASALEQIPRDLPFTLLYLLDEDQQSASLWGSTGLAKGTPVSPLHIGLDESVAPWPLAAAMNTADTVEVDQLPGIGDVPYPSPWPEPPRSAVVLPLARSGRPGLAGFLVLGISPRLPFDQSYRTFLNLLARQVATSLAAARAFEEEQRRAQALLEIDRAKTAFFSNVSHEFRTPLTLILGTLEEALSDPQIPPAARERLQIGHRSSLRLLRLVNTLLDFSRVEAGRAQAHYQPNNLAVLTADLASSFRSACEAAGLALDIDCQPLDEPVYVDAEMWEKVVLNLLSNAFKYTLDGRIEVGVRRDGNEAVVDVRDTGVGIPERELAHIFDRFHRVDGVQGRSHEGSGIGLALVKELVGLHGGSVSVQSRQGVGSTFTVRLPFGTAHLPVDRIAEQASTAPMAARAEAYVQEALRWLPDHSTGAAPASQDRSVPDTEVDGRKLVLIVDDNADMRAYLRQLLQAHYEVVSAADGAQALELMEAVRPDLVLADVMMPRLDGFGLLEALRSAPETRDLPIVLLSARAGDEATVSGIAAGADDYLVKPFSARELLARVASNLALAHTRAQLGAVRASEQRYRSLFESMDEACAVVEVLKGSGGQWEDFRFLDANAAFMVHTSMPYPVGKTATELLGSPNPRWVQLYGEALDTGRTLRVEESEEILGRTFDLNIFSLDRARNRVAVLFTNITGRKRAEESLRQSQDRQAFLLRFSDALRDESDVDAVAGRSIHLVFEYLGLDRCYIARYQPAEDSADFPWQVGNESIPALPKRVRLSDFPDAYARVCKETFVVNDSWARRDLSEEEKLNSKALGMRAMVASTARRKAKGPDCSFVAASARPRQWTQAEVTLVEEAAERTWAAIERARAETAQRESEARLAVELSSAQALQHISGELFVEHEPDALYAGILRAAMMVMNANAASLQIYEPDHKRLRLLASQNFHPESHAHWHLVDADSNSSCGRALAAKDRVVISDVQADARIVESGDIAAYQLSGLRSTQSTPLISRNGDRLGMISTLWREPHHPEPGDFDLFDVLARQAADLIVQRQSEAALRASEARLREFGEASQDVLWIRDAQTLAWTYLTPAFERIYGLGREEALEGDNLHNWLGLIDPMDRQHARSMIDRVVAGDSVQFEYRIRRPRDGQLRWLRNTDFPMRDDKGRITSIGGIGQDITTIKQAEERLTTSEERLRNATAVGKIALWDWNMRTDEVTWSDEHFRMQGYAVGEVKPSYAMWAARVHPDDLAETEAAIFRARDERTEYVREFRSVHPDGKIQWHAARGRFFYDEEGMAIRMVGAMLDTTARREWEERQKVLIAELQHRTFNLMGMVRSTADATVRTSTSLDDFRTRFHDRIAALARAQRLLSRLSEDDRVTFDELVRGELDAVGALQDEGRVMLQGPAGVALRSSTVQTFAMAVHELTTNAVKYGALQQPGGRLTVRWWVERGPRSEPWLHVDWRESGVAMPSAESVAKGMGQGRALIEKALPYQLRAKTSYALTADGVHCSIALPVSARTPADTGT